MTALDLAQANLLSPAVLCFGLGVLAVLARSDLPLPEPVFAGLSMYLMLAIGLKGGAELAKAPLADLAAPMAGAVLLSSAIPLWCYAGLRRFAGLSVPDAAALAPITGRCRPSPSRPSSRCSTPRASRTRATRPLSLP